MSIHKITAFGISHLNITSHLVAYSFKDRCHFNSQRTIMCKRIRCVIGIRTAYSYLFNGCLV